MQETHNNNEEEVSANNLYSMICKSKSVIFKWDISECNKNIWPVKFVTENIFGLTGYSAEDMISGRISWASILYPDDLQTFEDEINKHVSAFNHDFTQEYRIFTHQKKIKFIKAISSIIYKQNIPYYLQSILTDVTVEDTLHHKLIDSINKWKSLIESTKTAYIIMNEKGNIIETNSQMLNLLGFENSNNLVGINPRTIICQSDIPKYDNAFKDLLEGRAVENMELCICGNDSAPCRISWINVNAGLIENGEKKIFCLIRDISTAKLEEMKKFIEDQKQRDRLRQNISRVRDQISEISKRGDE